MNEILASLVALLVVAVLVALAARRLKLPYTVGLVATGTLLAWLRLGPAPPLTHDLIYLIVLPPLLFEAALNIHWKELQKDALPVLVLKPLCLRFGKVPVHRSAMGLMAAAYAFVVLAPTNEACFYMGMLLCGIGWSSLISIIKASWPRVRLMYTSASSSASSSAPCKVRPELSTPKRSHSASRLLRLPGYICLAMTKVSITLDTWLVKGACPTRSNSLFKKPMSNAALWMMTSASRK